MRFIRLRQHDDAVLLADADGESRSRPLEETRRTVIVLVDDAKTCAKGWTNLCRFWNQRSFQTGLEGQLQIMAGKMHNGFELPEDKFAILTERELFNKLTKRAPRTKISNAERLKSYTELAVGDYVVHVNHGVGTKGWRCSKLRYPPRLHRRFTIKMAEFILVPVSQIKLVQKYVSSDAKCQNSINWVVQNGLKTNAKWLRLKRLPMNSSNYMPNVTPKRVCV